MTAQRLSVRLVGRMSWREIPFQDLADEVERLRRSGDTQRAIRVITGAVSGAFRLRELAWEERFIRLRKELDPRTEQQGGECAFCGSTPLPDRLVIGHSVHICSSCAAAAYATLRSGAPEPRHLQLVDRAQNALLPCSFCGDVSDACSTLLVSPRAVICPACAEMTNEIAIEKSAV